MKYLLNPEEKRLLYSLYWRFCRRLPFPRWQRQRICDAHTAAAVAKIESGQAEKLVQALLAYGQSPAPAPEQQTALLQALADTGAPPAPLPPANLPQPQPA